MFQLLLLIRTAVYKKDQSQLTSRHTFNHSFLDEITTFYVLKIHYMMHMVFVYLCNHYFCVEVALNSMKNGKN